MKAQQQSGDATGNGQKDASSSAANAAAASVTPVTPDHHLKEKDRDALTDASSDAITPEPRNGGEKPESSYLTSVYPNSPLTHPFGLQSLFWQQYAIRKDP